MSSQPNRILSAVSVLLFLALLAGQSLYCFARAKAGLDSFVYVSLLNGGTQDAFLQAGDACTPQVPGPHSECEIGHSDGFREVAAYTPTDFATFLRFYRVKPLYTFAASVLEHGLRIPAFVALRALSAISYFVLGLTLALWLARHLTIPAACLVAMLIACTTPVLDLGKFLLPDAFSAALLMVVLYAVLYLTGKLWVQLLLLALLPLARPDNLLFCGLLGLALIYRATPDRRTLLLRWAALAACAVVLNSTLQHLTHALPFAVLFDHSFLADTPPSTYATMRLSLHDSLHTIASLGFKTIALDFPLPLLFAALALADTRLWQPLRDLVLVAALTCFARLLLFPNMEERYYTWFTIIAALGAAIALAGLLPAGPSWFRKPAAESGV